MQHARINTGRSTEKEEGGRGGGMIVGGNKPNLKKKKLGVWSWTNRNYALLSSELRITLLYSMFSGVLRDFDSLKVPLQNHVVAVVPIEL